MAKRLTQEEFIERATKVHNGLYDYSKVSYINNRTKVLIIDPTYGEFWQRAGSHLGGKGNAKRSNKITYSTDEYIKKAKLVHGDMYDYSQVVYAGNNNKICIKHPVYGEHFVEASSHLKGYGHPAVKKSEGRKPRMTTEIFISNARKIHNNIYDYSKVEYKSTREKVCIIDPVYGEFYQTPNNHLNGQGNPFRSRYGFTTDEPAYFYINKIINDGIEYFKFGITKSYQQRFSQYSTNVLPSERYLCYYSNNGEVVWNIEQRIKKDMTIKRGILPKKLFNHGYTETISFDDLEKVVKIVESFNVESIDIEHFL